MGEVDHRDLELLLGDVLPHIELGPVREREHPYVLARADAPVVEVPELRALGLGIPLAEVVAKREHPLLGAGALFIAAGSTECRIEPVLGDGVEQRPDLQAVA